METTADKIKKAQEFFASDANLTGTLNKHLESMNYATYSNEFSAAAKGKGIELTPDEITKHFNFQENKPFKEQLKETVKDEVKGAAKDEATGAAEDEIGNQLGVDVGGVGDAAGGIFDTIKGWFGGGKKKK